MEKIILGLIVVGAGVIIGFPKVRQALRIRINGAVDNSTAPIERLEDNYKQLMAKLPAQKRAVASAQASANQAKNDLTKANQELQQLEERYKAADGLGASEEAMGALEEAYADKEAEIAELTTYAAEAAQIAAEALKALQLTTSSLKRFAARVESEGRKAELTQAHNVANEVSAQLGEINSSLSEAGGISRQIDHDLETARAEGNLNKGSAAEQELAELETKQRTSGARGRLRAKTGLSPE